jgi:hypothetical protein
MKRSFLSLAVLTLLAVAALMMFTPGKVPTGKTDEGALLMPEVAAKINEINRLEIVSAGDVTVATLIKNGDSWQIEQMGGYQANRMSLNRLLNNLAQARVVETKTDKPEYYARLGVEDVSEEGAASVLVKLGTGDNITGVLIGHQAQGRPGQYVRLQDSAVSALVDRKIEVSTGQLDWTEINIVDIYSSEVAEVELIHPTGERVFVMRISADQTDFDLAGIPQGREIKNSWAVNSFGSVFSMLDMETVQPENAVDWNDAVKMRMLLFTGVEILADMVESGDGYMLRLHASHPAAKVLDSEPGVSIEQQELEKQAADDVAKTVEAINQKSLGWAYGISQQKFEAMVKKPGDLLKPLDAS